MLQNPRVADFRNRLLKLETATDVNDLFQGIDLEGIERIVLSGNTFGATAGEALGSLIREMPNLQVLELPMVSSAKISDHRDRCFQVAHLNSIFISRSIDEIPPALTAICSALAECQRLKEVDLGSNAFGVRTVEPVASLLSTRVSLEVVKLANNGLNSEGGRAVAKGLVESAKKRQALDEPPSLRVLILSRNRLEDGSASAWAEAISVHPGLQRFEISNAGLREDGILALASALEHCRGLTRLRLRDNVIANAESREGKRGWKAISDVIRSAKNLQYLDISACFIQSDGCEEIVKALGEQSYSRLRTIRLDTNDFAGDHYRSFQTVVEAQLPALRFLNLTGNEDLEDNDSIAAMGEMLDSRGGKLEVDDDDSDDEDEVDAADVDENDERAVQRADVEVDELADLINSGLNIKVT